MKYMKWIGLFLMLTSLLTACNSRSSSVLSDLDGQYSDPNHPAGIRLVSHDGNQITIKGRDQANAEFWQVRGQVVGNSLLIDFSPKGGPAALKATITNQGITFSDGNTWKKLNTQKEIA